MRSRRLRRASWLTRLSGLDGAFGKGRLRKEEKMFSTCLRSEFLVFKDTYRGETLVDGSSSDDISSATSRERASARNACPPLAEDWLRDELSLCLLDDRAPAKNRCSVK